MNEDYIHKMKVLAQRYIELAEEFKKLDESETNSSPKVDNSDENEPRFTWVFKVNSDGKVSFHEDNRRQSLYNSPPGSTDCGWVSTGLMFNTYFDERKVWTQTVIEWLLDKESTTDDVYERVMQAVALVDAIWKHSSCIDLQTREYRANDGCGNGRSFVRRLLREFYLDWQPARVNSHQSTTQINRDNSRKEDGHGL